MTPRYKKLYYEWIEAQKEEVTLSRKLHEATCDYERAKNKASRLQNEMSALEIKGQEQYGL